MRALLAIDDDERYEDVLRAAEWCLALGDEDEAIVAHVVATLRFMPFRDASEPGWAGTERAIFERVDDFLAEAAGSLEAKGLRARPMRLEGDVAESLLEATLSTDADVLVLGALGQARSQDFLVGSVAEKVQSLARRDVLLVRAEAPSPGERFRVLIAVDGSAASYDAIDAFAAKVRSERAEIRLLHVLELPPASWDVSLASEEAGTSTVPEAMRERADAAIRGALGALERHGLTAQTTLRRGRAASEVLAEASSFGASLVVLASHGEGRLRAKRLLTGTVTKRVARHAACSVLVVAPRDDSEASP